MNIVNVMNYCVVLMCSQKFISIFTHHCMLNTILSTLVCSSIIFDIVLCLKYLNIN